MRKFIQCAVLVVMAAVLCAAAGAQQLGVAEDLELRYDMLRSLYRTTPDVQSKSALAEEIAVLRQQIWMLQAAELQADSDAWTDIELRTNRTYLELALIAAEPPRWKFWRRHERREIEQLLKVIQAIGRDK